jgi:1-acyl-sn-glycerol-3-phosphate acyltransferase
MRYLKIVFWTLWRIWYYIMVAVPILVMFPFLLLSVLKETWYPYFFVMARIWAKSILFCTGFYYKVDAEYELVEGKSYILVANHTSMLDIMLMLAIVRNPFVFVGKKELAKIPLLGFFYKRTNILVDRNSKISRAEVYNSVDIRLGQGLSICIFPEGGVPDDESVLLDVFKNGAFRMAIEHQIPILPITFGDNKERFSYTFLSGSPGLMRAKIHLPIETIGLIEEKKADVEQLKNNVRNVIYNQLLDYQKK